MRKLIPFLLIFSGCAMRAQQSFPGINITPNGGAAGKVQFRTSANVNSMYIQDKTISSPGPIEVIGASSSVSAPAVTISDTGSGYLARAFAAGIGGWDFTTVTFSAHTGASWPGTTNLLMVNTTGDIGTSGQMAFYESAGLAGDGIVVRAPSGGVSSGGYTINLPGAGPSVAGQALAWVSGSTYSWQAFMANPLTTTGDIIYSSSGTTAARLGIGTAGQCLVVTAGVPAWGSCSSGASPFIDTTAILYSAATPANTWTVTLAGLSAARVATPPNSDFTMAGIDITQTFSADQTLGANLLFQTDAFSTIGTAATRAKDGYFGGVIRASSVASGTSFCQTSSGQFYCQTGGSQTFAAARLTGQITSAALAVASYRCLRADVNGDISVDSAACGTNPLTTTGDMIYSSSGTTAARLAIGSSGQYLTVSGGVPTWATLTAANTTLSNLGTTAINAALLFSADNSWDIGSAATRANDGFFGGSVRSSNAASSTSYCEFGSSGGGISCVSGGTTTFSVSRTAGSIVSFPLATGATVCLNANSGGSIGTAASGDCITTAGGQSIAGTTTLSTLSLSTTLTGNASIAPSGTGSYFDTSYNTGGGNPYRLRGAALIDNVGVWVSAGGINMNAGAATTGYSIYGGASGVTQTLNVATSVLGTCTITITGGIITASTC